jgi:hypothetical protein
MIPEEKLVGAQPQVPGNTDISDPVAKAIMAVPAASMPPGELSLSQTDELAKTVIGGELRPDTYSADEIAAGQAEAKRRRQAEIDKRRQEEAAAESQRLSERTMRVTERAEAERIREEALAKAAEARRQRILARRNIYAPTPPAGSPLPPGGPSAGPTGPVPTPGPRIAPPPAATRGPISAPSVSSVDQAPPMVPVRTLEGDFRKQNIGGKDFKVPLVELTAIGTSVPNASALSVEDFTSAYTMQDARAVADMIRSGGDPRAQQEQSRIDAAARMIASNGRLTPEERKSATDELMRRQAALHHGFLQSQGAGMGVRAGLGDVNPAAPPMEQVYAMMDQLRKQYPNADPKMLYEMAVNIASSARTPARSDGTVPYSVGLMGQAAAGEKAAQEAEVAKSQNRAVGEQVLKMQQQGWDFNDANEYMSAVASNDTKNAARIYDRHKLRQEIAQVRESMKPVSNAEIDRNIQTEVLQRDAAYSTKVNRLLLLQRAQAGDKKAQEELNLYQGEPEWDKAFGKGGELEKLDADVRAALGAALNDPGNRRKAEERIREKAGTSMPSSLKERNGALLALSLALELKSRLSPGASIDDDETARLKEILPEGINPHVISVLARGWKTVYFDDADPQRREQRAKEFREDLKAIKPFADVIGIEIPPVTTRDPNPEPSKPNPEAPRAPFTSLPLSVELE